MRPVVVAVVGVGGGACTPEKVDVNGPPPTTVPIRRLTNAEYVATVADLFPGYTLPDIIFVPDPKVLGFVNLSSSQTGSLVRMEQYEAAAFSIAQTVTADPTTLTGCDAAAQSEAACVGPFLADFGKRAYRRPLTGAEQDSLMALLARDEGRSPTRRGSRWSSRRCCCRRSSSSAPRSAIVRSAGAQGVPLTSWEIAARLSYFLTGTIPGRRAGGRGRRRTR